MAKPNLYLLDAYALIFRSYYAFIRAPRINSKGQNVSAVFGFALSLFDILTKQKPDYIAVAFDMPGGSFRNELYELYKAQREAPPEDILNSVPVILELLQALRIPAVSMQGYEADDVIGTLAKRAEADGYRVYMVTPDKDYGQLVSPHCTMLMPATGGFKEMGVAEICAKHEIASPRQLIDWLGLVGDTADNVPGCQGIGPKTASALLKQFPSVEALYENIDALKPAPRKKLEENRDITLLSKQLVEIKTDVPLEDEITSFKYREADKQALTALLTRLEFKSLLQRLYPVQAAGALFADMPQSATPDEVPEQTAAATYKEQNVTYRLLKTEAECATLWKRLAEVDTFAFDTETDGLDPLSCHIVGFSVAVAPGEAYFVLLPPDEAAARSMLAPLAPFMTNNAILKVAQNAKYDAQVLGRYGIPYPEPLFDTMIAHYLIAPENPHNLDALALHELAWKTIPYKALSDKKNFSLRKDVPEDLLSDYASEDADVTLRLYPILKKRLEADNLQKLFTDVEMPLVQVLKRMEERGVRLDTECLDEAGKGLNALLATLEAEITEIAGESFNLNSPAQVGEVLFDKLKIDARPKKTKTGSYATGEEVLNKYRDDHPIVNKLLDWRGIRKLTGTYIEALPGYLYPDGKLHTSFNQTIAATGRLSSSNPNLQNIPIRTDIGQEIRAAFVADSDECTFLSADYSQIELRLLAHFSRDEALIHAFKEGLDIHRATAARIYNVAFDEVTSQQRAHAKTANFGIIYGISPFGLSQRLHIPMDQARSLIDSYNSSYPAVAEFVRSAIEQARSKGYAETILGRRRYLPDISSRNATVRGFAERNAVNAPIQGSAADMIKIAMVRIDRRIRREQLKSRMIMQVHDELNFDAYLDELDHLRHLVEDEMTHALGDLRVPIEVSIGTGKNWLEAH